MSPFESFLEAIVDFIYRLFGYRKVTASSLLATKGGVKIQNGSVTLSYAKSGGTWTTDGTSLTDKTGSAAESVHLKSGTYNFKVTFSGGGIYEPSQAEEDGFKV